MIFWCVSLLVIFFSLPLWILIIVLILTLDRHPPIYVSRRVGLNSRLFDMYKFRTMYKIEGLVQLTTSRHDIRVTRLGFLLRKYKLDELPQLLNILFGQMSFVGPRPELPEFVAHYSEAEKVIFSVRPGLTDYFSLKFIDLTSLIDSDDPDDFFKSRFLSLKTRLRLRYVSKRGWPTDIRLMTATFLALIAKKK